MAPSSTRTDEIVIDATEAFVRLTDEGQQDLQ